MFEKLVVDLASYNRGVDPQPLHAAGVGLVILKADNQFAHNGRLLANSGMPIAAYHWIDPTKDAHRQVADTWNLLRSSGLPVLAVFLDFAQWWSRWGQWYKAVANKLAWESVRRFGGGKLSKHAQQVFEAFAAAGWTTCGYTRAGFVDRYASEAGSWMNGYRWWLAHHLDIDARLLTWEQLRAQVLPQVDFLPALPNRLERRNVVGHQFTSARLSLPGLYADAFRTEYVPANLSLFDGAFLEQIGAVPQPKALPEPLGKAIVTAYPRLNVRSGPGTSYPVVFKLVTGTPVQVVALQDGWARLRSFEEQWCSASYLQFEEAPAEPEPPGPEEPAEPVEPGPEPEPPALAEPAEPEPPALPEPPAVQLPGVDYQRLCRYGADVHVLLVALAGMRCHVTRYTGLKPVSLVARKLGAQIVVNGDGWGTAGYPNSIAASDGLVYQTRQFDFRPWINVSRDNQVSFDSNYRLWKRKLYNAVSGDRYIITRNGQYEDRIRDFNKEPRTAVGLARDGRLILLVADGRTPESSGLTFREMGYLFEEFGATTAINLDGGGSSALWFVDRIVNVPIEAGVPGRERAVANHLCVFVG